jgi:uncharacterized membrane protein
MMIRLARLVLGATLVAWVADWWAGERKDNLRDLGLSGPIRSSILIRAPIEQVWDQLVDIPGQVRWMRDLKAVSVESPGPIGPGTRARGKVRVLGITVPDSVEVTDWQPPERYGYRHLGPWRGDGIFSLTRAADDLTRVDWEERLVPPALPNLGDVLQHLVLGPIFQEDLEGLKSLLEGGRTA